MSNEELVVPNIPPPDITPQHPGSGLPDARLQGWEACRANLEEWLRDRADVHGRDKCEPPLAASVRFLEGAEQACRDAANHLFTLKYEPASTPQHPPGSSMVGTLEPDPWVDTRLVRFDDTIVFGHGGFDFDRWDNMRWEMHTPEGSWAVWKSGSRSWSMYGGPDGTLALDRYSCEQHARADAEQQALSLSEFAKSVALSSAKHRIPADEAIPELDLAWESVNAEGGSSSQDNIYDQGIITGIERALDAIEKLGGKDPAPQRAMLSASPSTDEGERK